jgi:GNAT superfamily N-acetyltransferase
MFERLKLKLARRHDANRITRLFRSVDGKIRKREVEDWIEDKEVFVLKGKKRIRGAFSFMTLGILGVFGLMYVRKLAVEKQFRGRGIGTLLLGKIKTLSFRMGATAFFLFSLKKAIRFYEKNKLSGLGKLFWWRREESVNPEE